MGISRLFWEPLLQHEVNLFPKLCACRSIRADLAIPTPGVALCLVHTWKYPGAALILWQMTQYCNPYLICIPICGGAYGSIHQQQLSRQVFNPRTALNTARTISCIGCTCKTSALRWCRYSKVKAIVLKRRCYGWISNMPFAWWCLCVITMIFFHVTRGSWCSNLRESHTATNHDPANRTCMMIGVTYVCKFIYNRVYFNWAQSVGQWACIRASANGHFIH